MVISLLITVVTLFLMAYCIYRDAIEQAERIRVTREIINQNYTATVKKILSQDSWREFPDIKDHYSAPFSQAIADELRGFLNFP